MQQVKRISCSSLLSKSIAFHHSSPRFAGPSSQNSSGAEKILTLARHWIDDRKLAEALPTIFVADAHRDNNRRSPAYHLDSIKAPLLMLAGGHDPRCPASETRQTEEAIKKRGGHVEMKIYDNEGHGFSKVENQIDAYRRVAAFPKLHVLAVLARHDNDRQP